jgi:hypothetical protein
VDSATGQCWLIGFGIAARLPRERQTKKKKVLEKNVWVKAGRFDRGCCSPPNPAPFAAAGVQGELLQGSSRPGGKVETGSRNPPGLL